MYCVTPAVAKQSVAQLFIICPGPILNFIVLFFQHSPNMAESNHDHDVVLYGWGASSCTWRVRIALAWKGIPYENVTVELQEFRQHDADFLKKNPLAQVPALWMDGIMLIQSVAILEYLEESRPQRPLLPTGLRKRALVRRVVETIASGIQPHQNLAGLTMPPGTPDKFKGAWDGEWGRMWIEKGFRGLEEMLKESSGTYCVGDEVTLADVCLVPQVYNAHKLTVDMAAFPTITRINAALVELDAFKHSHPSFY